MKPVLQRSLESMDCLEACIASILDVPLEAVPYDAEGDDEREKNPRFAHHRRLRAWLEDSNLSLQYAGLDPSQLPPRGYVIGEVYPAWWDAQPDINHCVVMKDAEIIWDPTLVLGPKTYYVMGFIILHPLDPSKPTLLLGEKEETPEVAE